MPMIEIDTNAKYILLQWKDRYGTIVGAVIDYSEAIRKAEEMLVSQEA